MPLKNIFNLLSFKLSFVLETNYMIDINWSFNSKLFINFMLMNMVRVNKNWNQHIFKVLSV